MDQKKQLYEEILDTMNEGVYFVDKERRIIYWNKGAEQMTGFPAERVVGSFCHANILNHVTETGVQLCFGGCPLHATIQDGKLRQAEVFLHHADGHRVPVLVRTAPMKDENGEIVGAVETFSSNVPVMSMRRRMDRLEKATLLDPLTGIGNRRYMELQLNKVLADYSENGNPCGLLFIDIDYFKSVNDAFGHEIGDSVLRMVAQTLKTNIRSDDILARWGGEEFIVLLQEMDKESVLKTAEKLRILVAQSRLRLDETELSATVSIGCTLIRTEDATNAAVERADRNMYQSKKTGRNRVTLE
ncbi:MAG TPA: diguanylate cyclase [Anaerolineales bacterium]|nr:diguanylate cyclase [Anaerolineales bacterium]